MSKEKTEAQEQAQEQSNPIVFDSDILVPIEVREEIAKKAEELKAKLKLRKIFVVLVEGDEDDAKPFYIAYLRRPTLAHFSQYMTFAQKDLVQANKMLAQNTFVGGDRELIDDDELFLYGTMGQLNAILAARNTDLVKR